MFCFTIRDLLWLTILIAVLTAWWLKHKSYELARHRDAETIESLKEQASQNQGVIVVPHDWKPPARPGGLRPIPGRSDYQFPATLPAHYDDLLES
jgi:hypothetical protein